ncbi:MAG: 2-amino-4-hydroxy-6-hydroxymethyldihydropteridine diphosphokinase [Muribaculaceae bacterium]|nr:2-amino-4-hydroxy-6-hydroxymethyldihydropteridine diphosphokinase [Muribaculaceae bacterium]
MSEVFLSFGSNYGDKKGNVEAALRWIGSLLDDMQSSDVYETPEVHGYGASYFNAVACGKIGLELEEFNRRLKVYERDCGRTEEARIRKEVPIDIDIVIWDGEIIRPVDFSREFFRIGYEDIRKPRN